MNVEPNDSLLQNARLRIGLFLFEQEDLPDEITLGGDQMLAVLQFPGGFKEVQAFGVQERNPSWSGVFYHENAIRKVELLDAMYRTGGVFEFKVENFPLRLVVMKKFNWLYRSKFEIPYEIELELVTVPGTLLTSDPVTQALSATLPPEELYPQGAYTVVDGDTLWGLALRFYGNGQHYKKIATANSIANPDLILPGQRLVIP